MKKIIIVTLILSLFLSFGCKTKKVIKTQSKEIERVSTSKESLQVKKNIQLESILNESIELKKQDIKHQKTDIEIKGKVDKDNPLTLYDIVQGDTLSSFQVVGNADILFKTHRNDLNSSINNSTSNNISNVKQSDNTVSNVVNSVVEKVKEAKSKTVEVVKKDFTIGSYFIFVIWGIVIIALCIFILWFRKTNLFTKIFKK